jgi:hypothetical protein
MNRRELMTIVALACGLTASVSATSHVYAKAKTPIEVMAENGNVHPGHFIGRGHFEHGNGLGLGHLHHDHDIY